jgi:hypothetical protein
MDSSLIGAGTERTLRLIQNLLVISQPPQLIDLVSRPLGWF